ncbi:MAG: hypothetical protein ABW168_10160 [Sedimenticola sp.]
MTYLHKDMSVLNRESFHEGIPAELSLFDLPMTQTAVQDAAFVEIRPLSQISGDVPLEFRIAASNTLDYLDLAGSQLYVKLKVTKHDGRAIDAEDKVGPVNLLLQSLFSTVEVTLQNNVTMTNTNYPYRAMIQTLLKYGTDADSTQLTSQGFVKDEHDAMDDGDAVSGSNDSLIQRAGYIALSKLADFQGSLAHDLFRMRRHLLNQVDVKVKLYRSSPAFCLMSGHDSPNYKIDIVDICLLARKIRVNPAVIFGHAEMLNSTNAKYPYTHTDCHLQSIPTGNSSFHWDNIFQGRKPCRVVVCFVESSAVSGSYTANPFNFQNCSIKSITLFSDGIPVGGAPSKLNFNKAEGATIARAYSDLFTNYGKWKKDTGNDITREDFVDGFSLFVFQPEAYFDGQNEYLSLVKTGSLRLDVEFAKPLAHTLTAIVYSESQGFFEIDSQRNIIVE